jgi:hypothetical protein
MKKSERTRESRPDAHAKFDAALCRCRGVAGDHFPLHLDGTAHGAQRRERALFVFAHQPRIAGDIDRQNSRQLSLNPPFAHRVTPVPPEICG